MFNNNGLLDTANEYLEGVFMYDLTSVLTTISAAAASFVAILGGLIASKLLSISGERDAVNENLKNLNNDLKFLQNQNTILQKEIDEDNAQDFILDHLDDLLKYRTIENCYPQTEQIEISCEALTPYWNKALDLLHELISAGNGNDKFNSDFIPNNLAKKYVNDSFSYEILKAIMQSNNQSMFGTYSNINVPHISGILHRDHYDAINKNNIEITNCKYKIEQLEKKKETLRSPKGIKIGLSVFGAFSLLCIILPLFFCPFKTDNFKCYLACKIVFIVIFTIGLLMIFLYLVYLLKWEKKKKERAKQPCDKS